jgi:hypothetical protein
MADDPIPFVLAGIVVSWVLTAYRTGRVIAGLTPTDAPIARVASCLWRHGLSRFDVTCVLVGLWLTS